MAKLSIREYKLHNFLHSILLLAGMVFLLSLIGWLLAGTSGMVGALLAGALVFISAPRFGPQFVLRLLKAKILPPEDVPQLYEVVTALAERADIKKIPMLYTVPGSAINAFTAGLNESAVIVLSDGMLRRLNIRELTGVLAHEISHISNDDLFVMLVADVISRLTWLMSFTGYFLILIYIPQLIISDIQVPWMLLFILLMAPAFSILMQLALSRIHEFNADIDAANLTGDPLGLASALEKIEYYQGSWVERMFISYRRMREPVLFRSHPFMSDRIKRLEALASRIQPEGYDFSRQ